MFGPLVIVLFSRYDAGTGIPPKANSMARLNPSVSTAWITMILRLAFQAIVQPWKPSRGPFLRMMVITLIMAYA